MSILTFWAYPDVTLNHHDRPYQNCLYCAAYLLSIAPKCISGSLQNPFWNESPNYVSSSMLLFMSEQWIEEMIRCGRARRQEHRIVKLLLPMTRAAHLANRDRINHVSESSAEFLWSGWKAMFKEIFDCELEGGLQVDPKQQDCHLISRNTS